MLRHGSNERARFHLTIARLVRGKGRIDCTMDQTQLPSGDSKPSVSEDRQPSDVLPAASTMHTPASDEHDAFPEDVLLEDEAAGWSAQFVIPFQQSGPVPAVNPQTARTSTNGAGTPV